MHDIAPSPTPSASDAAAQVCFIDEVIATQELSRRSSRPPDYESENKALIELARHLAESPENVLQNLTDTALRLAGAHSSGISIEENVGDEDIFRWHATSGEFARYLGGTMPRGFSPCGTVLDRAATMLMIDPVKAYPYIAQLHRPVREVLLVPFARGDKVIGTVWVVAHTEQKQFDSEDRRIITSLATFAAMATKNLSDLDTLKVTQEQLEGRVEQRTQDLARVNESLRSEMHERERSEELRIRLLQQLITAQENEQRRIARELHDQLGQEVTALRLKLAALKYRAELTPPVQEEIDALGSIARQLDQDVNFIVRQLRPTALDDVGLVQALDDYVTNWSSYYGVPAEFHATGLGELRLSAEIETVLYRVTQEALNNVAKHARADHVEILLQHGADETLLTIADDGVGFNVEPRRGDGGSKGVGLDSMSERAALVRGTMKLETKRGEGTTVSIRVPTVRR